MFPFQSNLAREVKQEVLAELQHENYTGVPLSGSSLNYPGPGNQGQERKFTETTNQTHQTVKDSVKNEVLAEIQKQQVDKMARMYGLDRSLSDQKIQQMVDARFRAIDDLKADIKKELLALQGRETTQTGDSYTKQIASSLAEEAHRQGVPQEYLMQSLEQQPPRNTGITGRLLEMLNTGQRRGFLGGVGMALLCQHVILPFFRGNMRSVAVRSLEEGMTIVERAKSLVQGQQRPQGGQQQQEQSRGQQHQSPPPINYSPVPEPPFSGGDQPPDTTQ